MPEQEIMTLPGADCAGTERSPEHLHKRSAWHVESYIQRVTRHTWKTGTLLLSRGLTVFLFLISGSFSTPPLAVSMACRQQWCKLVITMKERTQHAYTTSAYNAALPHCACPSTCTCFLGT